MERKYTIRVESSNPDFAPGEELRKGIEADGFVLLTTRNGKAGAQIIMGCTVLEIANLIAGDESETSTVIHQAAAIAEGLMKAREIQKEDGRRRMAKEVAEMLRVK